MAGWLFGMQTAFDKWARQYADRLSGVDHKLLEISHRLERLMSAISDYAAKVKQSFTAISAGLDGITGDLVTLNDKITALQNSPGQVTPEDQALLNEVQTLASGLADRVKALDDQTAPPAPPPTP